MTDNAYKFEIPKHHKSIIKVIGVGGGGSNAVNHMYNQGIKDVEFIVCNTDSQALKTSPVPNKLQIGVNLTEGLGAGANPEKGKNAAIESKEDIRELLSDDTKMLFVTAGMGGGTGTGAAPIIANVARELDILTVGIVTAPFSFEGKKKTAQAMEGIKALKESCDTVLVILNDKLLEIYGNLSISQAFAQADNILTTAAKGIAEIITVPGIVNVDFQDVRTVMKNSGAAVMGSVTTEGEDRAIRAAEEALSSPLLDNKDILGAQKILLSIVSGDQAELGVNELNEITEYIQDKAGDDAEVIFGHGLDPELGDKLRVTVIATGFHAPYYLEGPANGSRKVIDLETNKPITGKQIPLFDSGAESSEEQMELPVKPMEKKSEPVRTYSFEMPKKAPADEETDSIFAALEGKFEIKSVEKDPAPSSHIEDIPSSIEKEMMMRKKFAERTAQTDKLKGLAPHGVEGDQYKQMNDVPAYIRRKIKLESVPESNENRVSRYNLNDDNQILGNNKFLHDNVD
jgi:cell division protein FtsZ